MGQEGNYYYYDIWSGMRGPHRVGEINKSGRELLPFWNKILCFPNG